MPIACDSQSLTTAAQCFDCSIPPGLSSAVITYLLASISNNLAGTSMDPNVLANAAKAFVGLEGNQAAVQSYLLCQIATAVGA